MRDGLPGLHCRGWLVGAGVYGLRFMVYGLSTVCLWFVYGLSMVDVVVLVGAGDGIARRLSVESSRTPGSSSRLLINTALCDGLPGLHCTGWW